MRFLTAFIAFALFILIVWIDLPVNPFFKTHLGLDLKGGSHFVFNVDTSKVKKEDVNDAITSARDIIEKRVNFFGVSEPNVQTVQAQKDYRIVVDLPGITNTDQAVKLIGKTAELEFYELATDSAKEATDTPLILQLRKPSGLTGKDVKKANVSFNTQTGEPEVQLNFSAEGGKKFGEITARNIGKPLGIVVDGSLRSAPIVQQEITAGTAQITGRFTLEEARELATAINSGALPLPVKLIEQRSIGPSLGAVEIRKSVFAGIVGLLMVMLFMILYYRKLGVIACIALIIYGLITFAIFRVIPVVLTLSGVAGFILSIGMAVDSNILIFERIKEELRKGRNFDVALELGFGRAIDAIKDANITTILVGLILFNPLNWDFFPQSGLVRGFAVTLLIGVVTSLFTGIVITKRLITTFYKAK